MSISTINRNTHHLTQLRLDSELTADQLKANQTKLIKPTDYDQIQQPLNLPSQFQSVSEQAQATFHENITAILMSVKHQPTLNHVNTLESTPIADNISLKNAVFFDGTKAGLITVGDTNILVVQHADGSENYFQINVDGTIGNQIRPGEIVESSGPERYRMAVIETNDASKLVVNGIESYSPHSTTLLAIDPSENTLALETHTKPLIELQHEGTQVVPATTTQSTSTFWNNPTLLDINKTAGTLPTTDEAYAHYAQTEEGQLILNREEAYYGQSLVNGQSTINDDTKQLFIARVKFNSGEGGIELFSQFMPNRTALLDDPIALAAYDEQYNLILAEIESESRLYETTQNRVSTPVDPSLQVIMASGLSEAFAQSPQRVNEILTDIDRGWNIMLETNNFNGLYDTSKWLFDSAKASISYRLDALLYSYARPADNYDVVAHEGAHSLDGQGSVNLDGLPALSSADAQTLASERERLYAIYNASSQADTSGLRHYAYTDRKEFFADVTMLFLSGDQGARTILQASPELFDVLTRFYNTDYVIA